MICKFTVHAFAVLASGWLHILAYRAASILSILLIITDYLDKKGIATVELCQVTFDKEKKNNVAFHFSFGTVNGTSVT